MKKVHRRAWSLVLALVIAMTLLPVSGLAFSWRGEPREESYAAYYYVLLPSFTQGDSSRDPADFNFVGMGSVTDLGPPNGQSANKTIPINKTNIKYMTVPDKDDSQTFDNGTTKKTVSTYPSFNFRGNKYVYKYSSEAASSPQYTYDIVWYRYSSSTGYNIGSDDDSFSHYPPEYDGYTWHVDGYVTLSDKASVTYKVKFPGSDVFGNVDENGKPANNAYVVYVNKNPGVSFSEITAAPQMQPSIEEQGPNDATVTYTFDGWYYDEGCTRPVPPDDEISKDVVVYGKYNNESVSGSSYLDIEVCLDGKEIFLSDNESDPGYWQKYVTSVGNVSSTANVEVDGVENGRLRCTFDYTNFDAADITFFPGDGYVIQGVYGTFIYGMSVWNPPEIHDDHWVLDNVKGKTTLTVYLNTPYRLEYHVPAPASAPVDNNIYIACKKLDNFSPPVFPGLTPDSSIEDRNEGKEGGWVSNALHTTAELKDVPTGYTGWYTTADGGAEHESSYTGAAIAQAAGEDNVIDCYARPDPQFDVTYEVTGDAPDVYSDVPATEKHYEGDTVTVAANLTTSENEKDGVSGTWAFNGWSTDDVTVSGGEFTMPAESVKFTGSWTFTPIAPALTVEKTVFSVGGVVVADQSAVPASVLGGVIEYRLLIKNSGNTELTNVVVSDSLWAKGMEISVGGKTLVLEGGSYTIGSLAVGSSVSISYAHTVTGDEVQAGAVPNRASATADGGVSGGDTASVPVNGSIEIIPADITIYMGGDEGYEAVVGDGGTVSPSNSMPAPLFYVDPPASLGADVVNITLKGTGGRVWEFRLAGYDKSGSALYSIKSTGFAGQDPVRVSYTGADGKLHVNDSFDPGKIDELFAKYDIDIYRGGAQSVWAEYGGSNYGVATGTGKLVVRAVEDSENSRNPVISVVAEVTRPVVSGSAAVSAPDGTTYTLNDTTVPVKAEGVGLLFDGIIDKDVNRTEVLLSTIEAQFNVSINPDRYQAQYLDLVDANNGNAWVKASGPVTVYWGYPEGTGQNTNFTLYHFTDLHRDGSSSGFDVVDISGSKIELVKLRKTANGIAFEVEPGGFSPFVLVWENIVIPDIPVTPAEPVYEPNWLNTTEHFGYIIGYEDGTIKPDASITRAEVATIFFRLLTDEARDKFWTETNSYSDVAETAWYNNAISTLSRMGILGGYEDGTFRPNASITRAEFAKIAVSFFEYEDISAENIFTDVAAGSWYENFVAVAAKLGLIEGYAGNVYRPNESITRAEACTIINRTLGRAPDADHLLPESEMNTWPDNRPGVWYYAQLQEATNSHEYKWSGDIEHWTAKLPERDWDALQR